MVNSGDVLGGIEGIGGPSAPPPQRHFWLHEAPYLVILVLTLCGAAYTTVTRTPIVYFWEAIAVFSCAASIFEGWRHTSERGGRWRLVWTQVLHWGAFLGAMNLVFLPSVQAVANADSTSLIVLLLLALGTFVAGVHAASWRMGLNGVVMGLAVPVVAFLDQSALLLSLGALGALVIVAVVLVWMRSRG
ncbi:MULTISPECIES: hypothetical protein [unclassified Xanthobacter]|uniref:hypothetical protein n=1 Tax=unclassified Xanthobacter TaxID=2623496 RepID=UPI001EDE6A60|nr:MULTISPECIES: hypothetical protein [unclassified Xanthobacter]